MEEMVLLIKILMHFNDGFLSIKSNFLEKL